MCSNKKCPFQDSLVESQFVQIIGKCGGCLKVLKDIKNLVCKNFIKIDLYIIYEIFITNYYTTFHKM